MSDIMKDFPTLSISEERDGFWLWDKTLQMNLSMRAKTETEAFVKAIEYYQRRYIKVKTELDSLKYQVNVFVDKVKEE
jgi:hypothetical protein